MVKDSDLLVIITVNFVSEKLHLRVKAFLVQMICGKSICAFSIQIMKHLLII